MQDLSRLNANVPESVHECVHDLIAQRVHAHPNAPAVCNSKGKQFTYRELNILSDRLSEHLNRAIGPGSIVPLCFEKSIWTAVAMFAVLKAGGAFTLLDVSQPEARLQAIVRQTRAEVICWSTECRGLTKRLLGLRKQENDESDSAEMRPDADVGVDILVASPKVSRKTEENENLVEKHSPTKSESTCYVVFTSGSTGTPKGAVLSHSSICSAFRYQLDQLGFTPQSRVFDFASYSFDVAVHNMLATLVTGGCLCVPTEDERLQDPAGAMDAMQITLANLTPSVARLIDPRRVPTIQTLLFLGETLSQAEAQRWTTQKSTTRIINTYGPAECTPISTIDLPMKFWENTTNMGIGMGAGVLTWVVDAENHDILLSPGEVGELLLEGPLIGSGYLFDEEKTDQAFIPSPSWLHPVRPSTRLYKTGDLVQLSEDGSLLFMGRKDTQVKIHGQRVELGEIEHHVQACFPHAKRVIVEALSLATGLSLAAFIEMDGNDEHDLQKDMSTKITKPDDQFKKHLSTRLPSYMAPSVYLLVPSIPSTASGKTDRKRLRESGTQILTSQHEKFVTAPKIQPTSEIERKVQLLWGAVLQRPPKTFGLDDQFLAVGGDSLAAIKLVGNARSEGIHLRAADVLNPQFTLRDLAQSATRMTDQEMIPPFSLLESRNSIDLEEIASTCQVDASVIEDVYPCTPLQEGLVALTMQRPSDYILQTTLSLDGLDEEAVRTAWEQVYRETSILRTRIIQSNSGLLQVVLKGNKDNICWADGVDLQQYLEADRSNPIELGKPLARFAVVQDNKDKETSKSIAITLHHALYDAWSLDLIMERAKQLYIARNSDIHEALSKSRFNPFVKYIQEARRNTAGEEYWKKSLEDTDCVQFPAVRKGEHESHQTTSKIDFHCQLQPKNTTSEATMSTLIRGAMAILLSRHTLSSDVVFGTTVSGRNASVTGIEEIIGPTIATVPVRVQLDNPKQMTSSQFLRQLQGQVSEMAPFEQIGLQQIAKLGKGPKQACDFQTLLVVQPQPRQEDNGKDMMPWKTVTETLSTYALTIECFLNVDGSIAIKARYNSTAIDSWRLDTMLEQLSWIVNQLADVKCANRPLSEIDLFPPKQQSVIGDWNAAVPAGVDKFVHELIQKQVIRQPESHPAICAWDRTLTYQELDQWTDNLSNHLRQSGVETGDLIPICFEKSALPVIAMLAVFKAGAAFVPIEPTLPVNRRQTILEEADAKMVVASQQHKALFEKIFNGQVMALSWDLLQNLPSPHDHEVDLVYTKSLSPVTSIAYVIFTSGTTGKPKGVVVEHRAASSSCTAHGQAFGFNKSSRVLQFSSYAFDACIAEIFTTLIFGGCICIPTDSDRQSRLTEFINNLEVNWMFLTPLVAQLIEPAAVPCLRTIAIGGEKFSPADAERWACDSRRVIICYGPTECCVYCSGHELADGFEIPFIGLPIGCVAWVVDPNDHHQLMPLGAIGELLIEGPILSRGYLNAPEKSAESFIRDPAWLIERGRQGRLYKTGDLVQYAPKSKDTGGRLRYVGRKDTQVKIRGQRLELAEVEHHVAQCIPSAKQVVAEVIKPDQEGSSELLVGFVEMHAQSHPEPVSDEASATMLSLSPDVTDEIKRKLPGYMVPEIYFTLAGSMPRMTSSGKTDRRKLRELGATLVCQHRASMGTSAGEKRAPSSEIEKKLQSLWVRVLRIPNEIEIGLDDSFFHLGGDSITAMKLVAEGRKDGLALTVADVMKMPTLAAQARLQEKTSGMDSPMLQHQIPPFSLLPPSVNVQSVRTDLGLSDGDQLEDIYPCSPLQEGILALASKSAGDYILQNVLELPSDLRLEDFKAAWEETVRLTPILRTRVMSHHELGLLQIVQREGTGWINRENCDVEGYLQESKHAPMGLGQPLCRFALLGLPGQPRYFVWTVHHALYDGWSLPIITELASALYTGRSSIPQQQPFSAFIEYVEQTKQSGADTYWRRTFENNETSSFPALPPHIREPVADMMLEHEISSSLAKSSDVSFSTFLRAALALVISCHTGSSDVVFGATLSGRNAPVPGISDIVGPTIATVPLRIHGPTGGSVEIVSWLQGVQRQAAEMIPYEQTGLQHIARLSQDTNRACQFQTLLVIQADDQEVTSSHNPAFGTWRAQDEKGEFTTYALTLEYLPAQNEQGRFRARFDSRVIDSWTVERLLCQWEYVTQQLVAAAKDTASEIGCSVADIDVLSPQDRAILHQWNIDSPAPAAVERCVHAMITEQAQTQQTKRAIDGWDGQLTYGELNNLAERLAEYLLDLGVGPETFVPLCFPKSTWTIVAMLGVMKAGGAFVLLDPTHPTERLRMLCEKTRARVAIASSPSTVARIESFVETVIIVDKGIASQNWHPAITTSDSPNCSPPLSNSPSSSSSMQLVSPANTAYVIFTSGSTGAPKGCKIEHRSYCSAALHHGPFLQMSPQTRALQFGSYSFAGAIMEILMTLIHGGCICVPFEEERNPNILAQAIRRLNANWAFLTSSVLSALHPETVPCLRTVCVGGEAIQASQIAQWSNQVHIRQTYGSAETSAVVSSAHLTDKATTGDVGKPTAGRYWIVDPVNVHRLAPLGAVGEVIIEGPTIGREYLDESAKSAAAFISAPDWRKSLFGDSETKFTFYKTGDLASFTREGAIKLWGRRDAQVKLRGQRIELGEIEHQVRMASPLVKEVAVEIAIPKDVDGKSSSSLLVAFMVLREQNQDKDADHGVVTVVREHLQHILPQYMIPSAFIVLAEMPKTISKKTDRLSLREMASSYPREELLRLNASACDNVPKRMPTTDRDLALQSIWSHVLRLDLAQIGADDDFFQLGGDSVLALKFVAEARRANLVLGMGDVFTQRTLSSLAHVAVTDSPVSSNPIERFSLLIHEENYNEDELLVQLAASCGVKNVQIEDAYPCTPLQEGLLSLTMKQPGDYVLQNVVVLSEDLRLEDFQAAWQQTVSAVSMLRTRIIHHQHFGPVQVVVNEATHFQRVSVKGELTRFLEEDKVRPMEVGLPLTRFTLVDDQASGRPRWFVWTVHHALYDGWSLPLVLEMVANAYMSGTTPPRHDFVPFIKYLRETDADETQKYWRSELGQYESLAFPELPTPTHKPTADRFIEQDFNFDRAISQSGVTLSILIRAALGIIINRQTKTNDVLFGAVLSGRNAPVPDIQGLIGPTITTVPIRVQFPTSQSIGDYLHSLEQQFVDMIPHEQTGLQHIARVNRSACDFQTLLVIHPADEKSDSTSNDNALGTWLTGLSNPLSTHETSQNGFTTYALTLDCILPSTTDETIQLKASFDSTVIPEWEMGQLLDQFPVILQQLVSGDSEQEVADIDSLTQMDRAMIWERNKSVPQSVHRCFHDLVREQTANQPEKIALSSWDGEMTYSQLDLFSDRLAQHLIGVDGYHPGALVPLCFEKSKWTVVAMLASMKSGLTAVTMDITLPAERLRMLVQQMGNPPFILSSVEGEAIASQLVAGKPTVVTVPQLEQQCPEMPPKLPSVDPSTPVCVVYTSGSTGVPKGAALTHVNFASAFHYQAKTFGHHPGARIFAFSSYSFDISWFDTLNALASGSTLCIPSEAQRKDNLQGTMAELGVTAAFLTPSVTRLLQPSAVPSLRLLALAGEPQRWADFKDWPEHVTKISGYGPAECTAVCAAEDARIVLKPRDFTLPSFKGMGANVWLVDPTNPDLLVPPGAVGEMCLEGPIVGAGYVGDEKKTAAAFIENPRWLLQGGGAAHLPGRRGRLYRTGDMARYNSQGHLHFMGRKDSQVKIRGQRVELPEVEHHVHRVMRERDEARQVVAEIVALASDEGESHPILAAFVEQTHSARLSQTSGISLDTSQPDEFGAKLTPVKSEVVHELLHHLPSYMVPRVYFSLESTPRTVNGKTDRKRLRQLASQFSTRQLTELNSASDETKRQPATVAESCLQRLWAQVLRLPLDRVGADDNFFQLGGDSIAAMRLVASARSEGISSLTVAEIFRLPSLSEQAQMHPITDRGGLNPQFVAPFSLLPSSIDHNAICRELASSFGITDPVEDLYPCTPLQEGLFALTSKHAGDYVMQSVLELPDSPNFQLNAFKAAWEETVRATDILRTRIVEHSQLGLAQMVVHQDDIYWSERPSQNLERFLDWDKQSPAEFGKPLTRFALVGSHEANGGPRWFVWTVHHALYDGWSLPMVTERVAATYRRLAGTSTGNENEAPNVKFNAFVQYVENQRADTQLSNYWKNALASTVGDEPTAFPPLPASVLQPKADQTLDRSCPLDLTAHQTSSITTSTLVRAALALLISRQTGKPDATFGATVSGRNAPVVGIESIMGPTIATVPLRVPVPGAWRVDEYLAKVQQQATEMIPFEQTGLRTIAKLSDEARQTCDFQTLLVVQSSDRTFGDKKPQEDYGTWCTDANQQGFTTYALTIECIPSDDGTGLTFRASFDARVLEPWRMERLLVQLCFLTQQLSMGSSNTTLSDMDTLPTEDKEMIWKWNASVFEPIDRCVHDLIHDQVCRLGIQARISGLTKVR